MSINNLDGSQINILNNLQLTRNIEQGGSDEFSCSFEDKLPPKIKRRLKALKKLQVEYTYLEAKFYEEVHKLECRYNLVYSELYAKREKIVTGKHEPTDEECDFKSNQAEFMNVISEKMKTCDLSDVDPDSVGIPNFWLTIFKNVALLYEMVQLYDEPILSHLQDVRIRYLEENPMGFVLEFHFDENEYFTNKILTKEYFIKCGPDEQNPFNFEGLEIYACKGCPIHWKTGKDVTVKVIKKKQKHKSKGAIRTVTKILKNDSFFNFFQPPVVKEDAEAELDEDTQALLTTDFEIGHYLRERIVPNAVLYYTGEALEEEEEYDEDDDDEDDDDDDDDDVSEEITSDSDDSVFNKSDPKQQQTQQAATAQNYPPPDCKQQ